jgi:hypothetical protein
MSEPQRGPDNFAAAFEAAFARLEVTLLEACGREGDWPLKVASAVRSGLEFAAADPDAALLLTSEALAQGVDGTRRYERLIAYLEGLLRPGRTVKPESEPLPGITERALAGGVAALVSERLDRGRANELPALAPEAIQFVLTPYLGGEGARGVAMGHG